MDGLWDGARVVVGGWGRRCGMVAGRRGGAVWSAWAPGRARHLADTRLGIPVRSHLRTFQKLSMTLGSSARF